jgi:hypothetical protein
MKVFVLFIFGAALGAFLIFSWPIFFNSDSAMIETAKAAVKGGLFDPYSAQFEDLRVVTNQNGEFICGFVNAKNKMGGYVGKAPFVYGVVGQRFNIITDRQAAFLAGEYMVAPCFPRMEVPKRSPSAGEPWRIIGED